MVAYIHVIYSLQEVLRKLVQIWRADKQSVFQHFQIKPFITFTITKKLFQEFHFYDWKISKVSFISHKALLSDSP